MLVEVIQFLRPNGSQKIQYTEIDDDCEEQYELMKQRGWRLTAEQLKTGEISLTIEDPAEGDKEHEIIKNGPGVQKAIAKTLRTME